MNDQYSDDILLISRFNRGDRSAFDTLITRHQARAYQYAYRLCRDSDLSSDVVAQAFLRAFKALNGFKSESNFTTWLYRIITNCYLDIVKREKRRTTVSLDAPHNAEEGEISRELEAKGLNPHEEAEQSERERTLSRAVAQLPEYQKAMILMYHVEMLSYEEMAEILDVPLGTVKSRLNRARLSLRALLTQEDLAFAVADAPIRQFSAA